MYLNFSQQKGFEIAIKCINDSTLRLNDLVSSKVKSMSLIILLFSFLIFFYFVPPSWEISNIDQDINKKYSWFFRTN